MLTEFQIQQCSYFSHYYLNQFDFARKFTSIKFATTGTSKHEGHMIQVVCVTWVDFDKFTLYWPPIITYSAMT